VQAVSCQASARLGLAALQLRHEWHLQLCQTRMNHTATHISHMCCRFSGGNLTHLFAARVFEEHATSSSGGGCSSSAHPPSHLHPASANSGSEAQDPLLPAAPAVPAAMDLFDFLDFLLAWEHRGTPQGLRYFWAVLDVHRRGY
jgi:hypothetical protein